MPKKTKKQKILAQLHRKLSQVPTSNSLAQKQTEFVKRQKNDNNISIPPLASSAYIYKKESLAKPKIAIVSSDYSYVLHDLIKITIFTLFALAFQGVLYFILRTK